MDATFVWGGPLLSRQMALPKSDLLDFKYLNTLATLLFLISHDNSLMLAFRSDLAILLSPWKA